MPLGNRITHVVMWFGSSGEGGGIGVRLQGLQQDQRERILTRSSRQEMSAPNLREIAGGLAANKLLALVSRVSLATHLLSAGILPVPDYNASVDSARSRPQLKKNRILVLVGMALYVGAFFLISARSAQPSTGERGFPGWFCAFITLVNPWGHDGLNLLRESPIQYFSLLFSGWINLLFLIALLVLLLRPKGRLGFVLRIVLLLMFIAPWLVFYNMRLYPREGYFVWTVAMLTVIFAAPGVRAPRTAPAIEQAVDNRVGIS